MFIFKINQMATAPDHQRLRLLREVAGTRVYDERRNESLAILRETEGKIERIQEFLSTIEDKLKTLEEEKEELKQYQLHDKNRRALEYIIHEVELNDNKRKLADLEKQRNESGSEQKTLANNLKKAQDQIKGLTKKTKETRKEVSSYKEERDVLNNEHQHLIKEKAKLDLTIKDLSEEVVGDNKSKERAENELARLEQSIKEKEAELEKVKPLYEEMKKKEEDCTRELALKEQKRKELYAKQGRGSQFTSKDDRDKWIQNELKLVFCVRLKFGINLICFTFHYIKLKQISFFIYYLHSA